MAAVPTQAISMSCRQMLKAREIIVCVPDKRKARAVRQACESEIAPAVPASILRTHPAVTLYLDQESASELSTRPPLAQTAAVADLRP